MTIRRAFLCPNKFLPIVLSLFALAAAAFAQTPRFSKPHLFAPGEITTADFAFNASFTRDGNTVYFSKSDPVYSRITIVVSKKKNGHWATPEVVSFSGIWKDTDPFVSPDGKRIFFISNRPSDGNQTPRKDYDIWYVEQTAVKTWSDPIRLPATINTDGVESYPSVTRDGTLYFGSMRPEHPGMHIYRSRLVNGQYGEAELLSFSDKGSDIDPTVAADESFIVFSSRDRGGEGQGDIFVSFRHGDHDWTAPKNLGAEVNSSFHEIATALSPDNKTLYFASNRMDAPLPRPRRINYAELEAELHAIDNGAMKIYEVDIAALPSLNDSK